MVACTLIIVVLNTLMVINKFSMVCEGSARGTRYSHIMLRVLTFGEFGCILETSPPYICVATLVVNECVTVKYYRLRNHLLSTTTAKIISIPQS